MNEDTKSKLIVWVCCVLIICFVVFIAALLNITMRVDPISQAKRQEELSTFYRTHNCKPLGYIASRGDPVRTYQCDNGVFITRDMK